jgi:putative flippase GtrA
VTAAVRRQFLIYLGVGVLSALIDLVTIQLLLWLALDHRIAVSVGYVLGTAANYLLHERFTFRAQRSAAMLLRFGVLLLVNYALTMLLVQLSVTLFDSVMAGKLVALPIVAVNGFLCGRYWVFRKG